MHRHIFEHVLLSQVNAETASLEYAVMHGPFAYCPICKRRPTKFLGKDAHDAGASGDDVAGR